MFDIGFWEIAVIAAIMLVVLGPERLPGVARTAGFWLSKIRRMVSDVKSEVKREMDAAELTELEDAKNQIQEASKTVHKQINKDVLADANITAAKSSDSTDSENKTQVSSPEPSSTSTSNAQSSEQSANKPVE